MQWQRAWETSRSAKVGFIAQYGLWSVEQRDGETRIIEEIDKKKLKLVRVSLPDRHGIIAIKL